MNTNKWVELDTHIYLIMIVLHLLVVFLKIVFILNHLLRHGKIFIVLKSPNSKICTTMDNTHCKTLAPEVSRAAAAHPRAVRRPAGRARGSSRGSVPAHRGSRGPRGVGLREECVGVLSDHLDKYCGSFLNKQLSVKNQTCGTLTDTSGRC